jgi:hypothetical protein
MKKSKRIKTPVKFFLSDEENRAYEAHLAPFAGKKGPYAKRLLLDRIKVPANESADEGEKA